MKHQLTTSPNSHFATYSDLQLQDLAIWSLHSRSRFDFSFSDLVSISESKIPLRKWSVIPIWWLLFANDSATNELTVSEVWHWALSFPQEIVSGKSYPTPCVEMPWLCVGILQVMFFASHLFSSECLSFLVSSLKHLLRCEFGCCKNAVVLVDYLCCRMLCRAELVLVVENDGCVVRGLFGLTPGIFGVGFFFWNLETFFMEPCVLITWLVNENFYGFQVTSDSFGKCLQDRLQAKAHLTE